MKSFPLRFNMASYFLDDRVAEGLGSKVALRYENEQYTYRQVQEMANRAAGALRELGLEPENRVLIALPDVPEFAGAWFGTLKAGGVFAMVNPLLPADDYRYYLEYTRATVLVTVPEVWEKIRPFRREIPTLRGALIVRGEAAGDAVAWDRALAAQTDDFANADTHRDDAAGWLFTSGSTGKPKAAIHRHADFPFNTEAYAKGVLGIRESDVTLSVPKLFFGYATGTNLMFPFSVGATAVLFSGRATADELFDRIRRYRPTFLTNVPTMIATMVDHPDRGRFDLSCLRTSVSAGEALPEALYRRWQQAFGVEILDGIGSAEMFHIYITNFPGDVKPGSLGKIVPGYDYKIVDEEGQPVAPGDVGTLWVRGESAAVGYWQDRAKSLETFQGDWCTTGDQFRVDEGGCFWYSGRRDDLLKVGGVFVSPVEVENALLSHPAVAECAVVGYRDEADLVKPKAYVVPAAGREPSPALRDELQAYVKGTLAMHKYPRRIEFVPSLPKNDRGKVDRKLLKQGEAR